MDNYDKLFNQIKDASQKTEAKDFPAIDKVWNRVEDKLDHKVLKKQNKLWKKIAIAASLLLLLTLGYQFLKPQNQIEIPKNEVVTSDSLNLKSIPLNVPQTGVASGIESEKLQQNPTFTTNPTVKANADEILERQIKPSAEAVADISAEVAPVTPKPSAIASEESAKDKDDKHSAGRFLKGSRSFDSRSVSRSVSEDKSFQVTPVGNAIQIAKKEAPLFVVDGKAVKDGLSKLDPKDVENIVVLKEPLYVINGHYYSELELFGPNPTSPYAPLNQQEIETLSILQGEKAIANYGEKGRKGVVIITTKDRKPVKAASKKSD